MADKKKGVPPLTTPKGIILFPFLFTPRAPAEGAEKRFSLVMIFDEVTQRGDLFKDLKRSVHAAIAAEWGNEKAADKAFIARLKLPFRSGSEKPEWPGMQPSSVWISPWSKAPVEVVDGYVQPLAENEVWMGQIGKCNVRPFAYSVTGNMGIALGLNQVQITKTNAPRLDGRKSAKDVFAPDTSDMETAGAGPDDDDTPF